MIVWDIAGLKHIEDSITMALEMTAETLQDEIREEQVIPRDVGTLQGEAFTVDRSRSKQRVVSLQFNTPYARRLYYHPEYNFQKDENINAQGMWMEHWLRGGKYEHRAAEIFDGIIEEMV